MVQRWRALTRAVDVEQRCLLLSVGRNSPLGWSTKESSSGGELSVKPTKPNSSETNVLIIVYTSLTAVNSVPSEHGLVYTLSVQLLSWLVEHGIIVRRRISRQRGHQKTRQRRNVCLHNSIVGSDGGEKRAKRSIGARFWYTLNRSHVHFTPRTRTSATYTA